MATKLRTRDNHRQSSSTLLKKTPAATTGTEQTMWQFLAAWHARAIQLFQDTFSLSNYAMLWIAFIKGLIYGMILASM